MINILELQIKKNLPVWNVIISAYFYMDILYMSSLFRE